MLDLEKAKMKLSAGDVACLVRRGGGRWPLEAAVLDISDPQETFLAIRNQMAQERRNP